MEIIKHGKENVKYKIFNIFKYNKMSKTKKEKTFWKSYFGVNSPLLVPERISRLPWKEQSVTDDDLEILSGRVNHISQLDLDHNLITNSGIEFLTKINIKELRLKDLNIDDHAIPFIQKIKGLELLHIGGTNVSCEGIGQLNTISSLKTLICTPNPINDQILDKFKEILPSCELIVDYKLFE